MIDVVQMGYTALVIIVGHTAFPKTFPVRGYSQISAPNMCRIGMGFLIYQLAEMYVDWYGNLDPSAS